jgi:lipopolysaccharide assembly outer membrane protein LptD (OstA)
MKRTVILIFIILLSIFVIRADEEVNEEETENIDQQTQKEETKTSEEEDKEAEMEETKKEKKQEVEETRYSAKKIEYLIDEDLIILVGEAWSKYKDIVVIADTIEYNVETKIVRAYGNPFLIDDKDTIAGEIMVYNIETKRGLVTLGDTKIEKGFFTGDTILKVGEKTLNVKEGNFTTCSNHPAHYSFYSKRMKVYGDDMVVCEPVILKIQDIPLFIIPFWFFPIRNKRHSGFLFPKVGKGSSEGRYVRDLSFFWATNDYSDVTFTFDIFEKRGIRSFVNARYIVTPFLTGTISGSYINDTYTKSKRWNLYMNHRQTFRNRLTLTAHANFMSDANYNVDYSEEEIVQLNKEIESYASVSKSWSGANLNFLVSERRDLADNTIDRRLPRVRFALSSRRIISPAKASEIHWYNTPYVSYSSGFVNKIHIDKNEDSTTVNYGLANNIALRAPQKVLTYFNISPSLTIWENIYDNDIYGNKFPVRSHYSTSLSLSTVIYGLSKGGIYKFKKFRHVIKPSISYNYSPSEENPEKYYSLEGMGVGNERKNISFSLSNLIQTKMDNNGKETKINLINANTNFSYNFKKAEEPLSNIRNSISIEPIKQLSTRVQTEHNPYSRELKEFTVRSTLNLKGNLRESSDNYEAIEGTKRRMWNLHITHNFVKGIGDRIDSQQLFGGISTWVTENWKIGLNTRYDFDEKKLIDQSLSIYRDLHCWEASFSWNSYGGRWKYDLKINIKKIPEIKVTKGVFGIFIP